MSLPHGCSSMRVVDRDSTRVFMLILGVVDDACGAVNIQSSLARL